MNVCHCIKNFGDLQESLKNPSGILVFDAAFKLPIKLAAPSIRMPAGYPLGVADWSKSSPVFFENIHDPWPFGRLATQVDIPYVPNVHLRFIWEPSSPAADLAERVRLGYVLPVFIVDPEQVEGFRFCLEALWHIFGHPAGEGARRELLENCSDAYKACVCDVECCEPGRRCRKARRKVFSVSPLPFPLAKVPYAGVGSAIAWSRLDNPPCELQTPPDDYDGNADEESAFPSYDKNGAFANFLNPKWILDSFVLQHDNVDDGALVLEADVQSGLPALIGLKTDRSLVY